MEKLLVTDNSELLSGKQLCGILFLRELNIQYVVVDDSYQDLFICCLLSYSKWLALHDRRQ